MKSVISMLQQKQQDKGNQGLLATYMYEHIEEVVDLTIKEVAERGFVSTATVSRLAKACGFKGFSELKYQLVIELTEIKEYQQEHTNEIVDCYLNAHFNAMLNTSKTAEYKLITELAASVFTTSEVIIFATGATLLRAMDFEYKLRRIGIRVISCMDFDQQLSQSKLITNSTTCIAISYGGDAKNVLECIGNVVDRNIDCYFISTRNSFGDNVKHIKLFEAEPLTRNYAIYSSASISCILDLLFLELVKLNSEYFNTNLESTCK